MNAFRDFLRELGLRPGQVVPDEKVRRCRTDSHPRKRDGAYWLAAHGRIGWGWDPAIQSEHVMWYAGEDADLPDIDPEELKRVQREAREDLARKRAAASQEAREFYASCRKLRGGHPYLESHGLGMRGCSKLRVDDDGRLVAPCYTRLRNENQDVTLRRIVTLQTIDPDGTKLFWPGAPASGASLVVTRPGASMTVLAEGLATALALYASIPTSRAIVAFTAGNMYHDAVLECVPAGMVAVAADNDHGTEQEQGVNPGVEAATKAAGRLGCGVAIPDCAGTDWSDYRQERLAWHRERLGPFDREFHARQRAEADVKGEVEKHARLRKR